MNSQILTFDAAPPVRPNEVCTITTPELARRAALLFDRVRIVRHLPETDEALPQDPSVDDPESVAALTRLFFSISAAEVRTYEAALLRLPKDLALRELPDTLDPFLFSFTRSIVASYLEHGVIVVPLYSSESEFRADFGTGPVPAYQAAFSAIPIVSTDTPWDQIFDFREDPEAVRKYRALRLWLRDGLQAKSLPHAMDMISQRLDDYRWAIRKHGFRTVLGALSSIVDGKTVTSLATGAGVAGLLAGPTYAALSAGLILTGKACVWLAQKAIESEDITRASEVAVLYDADKRFRTASTPGCERSGR